MRLEDLYLVEIIESADLVASRVRDVDLERWRRDEFLRDAVLHRLMIVGEAARSLSVELKTRHPEVPWARIIGFRNIVVHEYFAVESARVWEIARGELPALRRRVAAILADEFPQTWERILEGT
jgi:uncharacterized protein with HEPN domain